jgi:O-antigen ligase
LRQEPCGVSEAALTTAARPALPDGRAVAIATGTTLGVAALAAADGGYFPSAWGWAALVAAWVAGVAIVAGRLVRPSRLQLAFLAGIGGLAGWVWLSILWSEDAIDSVLEGQRMLLYATAALALVLVLRARGVGAALGGVLAAVALAAGYGLATRLFPDRLGVFDPVAGYRLSEPLGYWNGMGIFTAIGVLLALGFAARARSIPVRSVGAGLVVLLAPALYFTFGRGPWVALGVGLLAALVVDPRRLQLIGAATAVGAPAALAVLLASRADALRHSDAPIALAAEQGGRLAVALVVLAAAAAALAAGFALAERRVALPRRMRVVLTTALLLAAIAVVVVTVVRLGGPTGMVEKGYDAFDAPPPATDEGDMGARLFSFAGSYRIDLWESAWRQYEGNPVLGGGAGSFEQHWLADRSFEHKVRDAHNLYVETLAELGPLGLALLLLALGAPLVAGVLGRSHRVVPPALGAYAAYLVHAGIDWDWELPALTLAALICGGALLACARRDERTLRLGPGTRAAAVAGTLAVAAVALVTMVGNTAIAASDAAADSSDWNRAAAEARKAKRWAPWSSEPWQRLGEAQLGRGDLVSAEASFREAIEREPTNFELWLDLARATGGADRAAALARAESLNPFSPEIEEFRAG